MKMTAVYILRFIISTSLIIGNHKLDSKWTCYEIICSQKLLIMNKYKINLGMWNKTGIYLNEHYTVAGK